MEEAPEGAYSSLAVPKRGCRTAGEGLCVSDRTRGNGFKLKEVRFRSDMR